MAAIALAHSADSVSSSDSPGAAPRRAKIRVGLFAENRLQPRWVIDAFTRVDLSDFADLVLVAVGNKERKTSLPLPWRVILSLDQWVFGTRPDPFEPVDLLSHVTHGNFLRIPDRANSHSPEDSWRTEDNWLEAIATLNLDVIFVLGDSDIDIDAIKSVVKFGVCQFSFGGREACLDPLVGMREVMNGALVTASGLSVHPAGGGARLLYRSWTRTFRFSMTRNRNNLLRRTKEYPARMLRDLYEYRNFPRESPIESGRSVVDYANVSPGPVETLKGLAQIGRAIVRRGWQKMFCVDQWFLGFRFDAGDSWARELGAFHSLVPPKDRFWADPFPIERNGRHFIFFEELVFAEGKAHISVVEVDRSGLCSMPRRVLEQSYHLSYPFLIEADGELFMVPETGQNRSVELYRCVRFPDRWQLEKVLLRDAFYVDATLHQADGLWWMFVNIGTDAADVHDELHLYYASDLLGEWRPHCNNPVKSDVRGARSAGRIYMSDGRVYRPAQICTPLYGSGISINHIQQLTPQAYREHEVARIVPQGATEVLGIHTLNRAGSLSVIDAFTRRPRFSDRVIAAIEPEHREPLRVAGRPHERAYGN